jgi:hypothetical protein
VGVDKYILMDSKWANNYTKICVLTFCCVSGSNGKIIHYTGYHTRDIAHVSSILIQAAIAL